MHWEHNSVGDINSTEPGSAARYNADKLAFELIPVEQLLTYMKNYPRLTPYEETFLRYLMEWQWKAVGAVTLLNHLLPDHIEQGAKVLEFGAKKYAAWNWARGMKYSVVTGSLLRHLWKAVILGEEKDDESGLDHWGHIACNVIFLVHYERYYKDGDDRPDIFSDDTIKEPKDVQKRIGL